MNQILTTKVVDVAEIKSIPAYVEILSSDTKNTLFTAIITKDPGEVTDQGNPTYRTCLFVHDDQGDWTSECWTCGRLADLYDVKRQLNDDIQSIREKQAQEVEGRLMLPNKYQTVKPDMTELEYIELESGFHLGVDSTYLQQVGDVHIQVTGYDVDGDVDFQNEVMLLGVDSEEKWTVYTAEPTKEVPNRTYFTILAPSIYQAQEFIDRLFYGFEITGPTVLDEEDCADYVWEERTKPRNPFTWKHPDLGTQSTADIADCVGNVMWDLGMSTHSAADIAQKASRMAHVSNLMPLSARQIVERVILGRSL